jgi:hypothetical protein
MVLEQALPSGFATGAALLASRANNRRCLCMAHNPLPPSPTFGQSIGCGRALGWCHGSHHAALYGHARHVPPLAGRPLSWGSLIFREGRARTAFQPQLRYLSLRCSGDRRRQQFSIYRELDTPDRLFQTDLSQQCTQGSLSSSPNLSPSTTHTFTPSHAHPSEDDGRGNN